MSFRNLATLALAATVVVVTAACGDDDAATTPSALPSTVGTTAATVPKSVGTAATTTTAAAATPATSAPTTAPATIAAPPPSTTRTAEPGEDPAVTFTSLAKVDAAVDLAWRPGDEGLYVVQQFGKVARLEGDTTTTVLDISDLTGGAQEQGLLGLAFDPTGELAYVNYTDADGWTVIAEYPVDADGTFRTGDEARIVLEIEQPYSNHNGGDLTFGPDGMLYIGMGDGGDAGDPERRATDMTSLLGKMLRIDPAASDGQAYTVPADNPFVGDSGAAPEIWSSGLRNPWRFSFDRGTGDLWIADVGQGAIEEIDAAPATAGRDAGKGLSFGWSAFEGDARFNDDVSGSGHTPPFSQYTHDDGRCSISGGLRVRGGPVPAMVGWYVYADFCSGQVWALEVTGAGDSLAPGRQVELGSKTSVTAVVDGPDGELYVLSSGEVSRLDPA